MEETFVLLKPEALQRALVGRIISILEDRGFKINALWMHWLTDREVDALYAGLREWQDYNSYRRHLCSGPCIAMIVEGRNAVSAVRSLVGVMRDGEYPPNTIRHTYSLDSQRNLIHCSADPVAASYEVSSWRAYRMQWERLHGAMVDHTEVYGK